MDNDSTDTEASATEAGRGSGIWTAVGWSCLAATLLVAVGYVAAAILAIDCLVEGNVFKVIA